MADSVPTPLIRAAVKVGVGVGLLLLVQFAVSNLPMLNQAIPLPSAYLTYGSLASAALKTAMFVLLFRFGSDLRVGLNYVVGGVPEVGQIAQLAIWLLTITLAYVAYGDIAAALFGGGIRIYQFVFVVLAVVTVAAIGALVFRNLDALTDVTMRHSQAMRLRLTAARQALAPPSAPQRDAEETLTACAKCGASIGAAQKFCRSCGAALQNT